MSEVVYDQYVFEDPNFVGDNHQVEIRKLLSTDDGYRYDSQWIVQVSYGFITLAETFATAALAEARAEELLLKDGRQVHIVATLLEANEV